MNRAPQHSATGTEIDPRAPQRTSQRTPERAHQRIDRHPQPASGAVAPNVPGCGLPQDRHARIAGRRAFIDLRQQFGVAINLLDGPQAEGLRQQLRRAREPGDLWRLRGPVLAALGPDDNTHRRTRDALQAGLDQMFPDSGELLPLMCLA